MKLHRFYVGDSLELDKNVWVNDQNLLHQWTRVLRFQAGQQIILFNNIKEERLYNIDKIEPSAVHLSLVTNMSPKVPEREVYLCFSILKKDKNDWVFQKTTELGVRHFVPLITSRTEKTGFDIERARKIMIEASEQCGRSDVPSVREPITLQTAIAELQAKAKLLIAEQSSSPSDDISNDETVAVFVGPEGGWSDEEKETIKLNHINYIDLNKFTLRAETACVVAVARLCK